MSTKRSKKARSKPANSRKAGRGRKSDYLTEFADQAERLCRLIPATDEDIAAFFGKSVATINRWKAKHPEFCEAIKRGKLPADVQVANSLFENANGAEWVEQVPIKLKTIEYNEAGKKVREEERIELVTVRKARPPDTMAGMYWLNNRQGDHWRQRQEITGKGGGPLDVNLTEVRGGIASKLDRIAAAIAETGLARQPQ